jgi:hypothetical protein
VANTMLLVASLEAPGINRLEIRGTKGKLVLSMNGAAWEKKLNELIAESKIEKKTIKVRRKILSVPFENNL